MEHHPFYHTAIIGAGASGLFCAGSFEASKIVLEANDKPALKVSVSGGGKCNFSNRFVSAANYESQNKHFCKSALAAFTPNDFTALLDQAHIPWHARENGQLFATNAADIVRFLVQRAKSHHTVLSLGTRVLNIQLQPDGFVITTSKGLVHAGHLVLASGGISWPKLGGNTFGLKMARQLGLPVVEQRPVLCGLTFPKPLRLIYAPLAGSSTPVIIRQGKRSFEGDLLFTHEGISGPAVLRLSLFWQPEIPVEIDFLPHQSAAEIISKHKNSTKSPIRIFPLPYHMAKILLAEYDAPLSNATRAQLHAIADTLHRFRFTPAGVAGYTKAEATAGGIDTRGLFAATLEARNIPHLFVIGELVDVTGNLGGYNLHWAWASGFAAAQALKQRM